MKFKFNFKLTIFLVSLFVGLLLLILGNANKYCLSFGFIVSGLSLELFVWYYLEKLEQYSNDINTQIDEIEAEEIEFDDEELEELKEEETVYALKQLYIAQKKIKKKKRSVKILFTLCGALLAIIGVVGMF